MFVRRLTRLFSQKATGGLSIYWAIMIAVILVSGYLVGGLIPSRTVPVTSGQSLSYSPAAFKNGLPVLQLGSLQIGGCRGLPAVLFLVDSSETMQRASPGTSIRKIDLVKTALLHFTSKLTDRALVGIITYSDTLGGDPSVKFPFREIGPSQAKFQTAVSDMGASGLSYFRSGMETAEEVLAEEKRVHPDYQFNLIVISDGIPETEECAVDRGNPSCVCKGSLCFSKAQDPTTSPSVVQKIKDMDVPIYTIGIGADTPTEAAFSAEFEKMLTDTASQPLSRYFIMTPSATNLNELLSRTGSSLCLE